MKIIFNTLLILSALLLTLPGHAQSLSRSVIGSAGSTNERLSFTVGESVIKTGSSSTVVLTQGFQQPDVLLGTFVDPLLGLTELSLYPNPTLGDLRLDIVSSQRRELQVEITDITGRRVLPVRQLMVEESLQVAIDVHFLATATYVLIVKDESGRVAESLRFQKIE